MKKALFLIGRMAAVFCIGYAVLSLNGCRRPFDNTSNVLKIDTLQQLVTNIDDQLILDENVFSERDDSMKLKLGFIHSRMKVIEDGDTSEMVLRYEGIQKNYEDLLKNYPVMEYDESDYRKTVQAMKKKVVEKNISQEAFDKYYITTKPALEKLYERAKTTTYDNLSIEKDYQRTDPAVTALYQKVMGEK